MYAHAWNVFRRFRAPTPESYTHSNTSSIRAVANLADPLFDLSPAPPPRPLVPPPRIPAQDTGSKDVLDDLRRAWGVGEEGLNVAFSSLSSILMNAAHRPAAFEAMCERLETLWAVLRVPLSETQHIR